MLASKSVLMGMDDLIVRRNETGKVSFLCSLSFDYLVNRNLQSSLHIQGQSNGFKITGQQSFYQSNNYKNK